MGLFCHVEAKDFFVIVINYSVDITCDELFEWITNFPISDSPPRMNVSLTNIFRYIVGYLES